MFDRTSPLSKSQESDWQTQSSAFTAGELSATPITNPSAHDPRFGNAAAAASIAKPLSPGEHHFKTVVEHQRREYSVYVPHGYDGSSALPVVYMLPGVSETIDSMKLSTLMNKYADKRKLAVVYLQTLEKSFEGFTNLTSWNLEHGSLSRKVRSYDDVNYVGAIHDKVSTQINANEQKEFLIGHSEGGDAAQYLMQKLPYFAGFASVHGTRSASDPVPPRRVHGAALLVLARRDGMLPIVGGFGDIVTMIGAPKVSESLPLTQKDIWAAANKCGAPLVYYRNGDQITDYRCKRGPVREIIQWNAQHPWNAPVDTNLVLDFLLPETRRKNKRSAK